METGHAYTDAKLGSKSANRGCNCGLVLGESDYAKFFFCSRDPKLSLSRNGLDWKWLRETTRAISVPVHGIENLGLNILIQVSRCTL